MRTCGVERILFCGCPERRFLVWNVTEIRFSSQEFAKEVQECMVMESEEHDETDPDSEHQAELAASNSMKDQAVQKPEKRYRLPQQHAQDGVKRRHRSMGGKTAGFYLSMG